MGERERERGRAELEPARVGSGQARQGKARKTGKAGRQAARRAARFAGRGREERRRKKRESSRGGKEIGGGEGEAAMRFYSELIVYVINYYYRISYEE